MKTLFVFVALFLVVFFSFFFIPFYYPLIGLLILLLLAIVLPVFTVVKEGTTQFRLKLGAEDGPMFQKKGYVIDPATGDMVPGRDERFLSFLGGLHFVGIRWVNRVHERTFEWKKAIPNGKPEERKEKINFTLTGVKYGYGVFVPEAEDIDSLPLDVNIVMTAMVVNPRKAVFEVHNWFTIVSTRIVAHVREKVKKGSYVEKGKSFLSGKDIFDELKDFRDEVRDLYGVEILSVEVSEVDPPPKFREATIGELLGKLKALESTSSIGGVIIGMLHQYTNTPIEDIRSEFRADAEGALKKYKSILDQILPIINRDLMMKGGGKVFDFGPDGIGLAGLATLLSGFGGGGKGPGTSEKKEEETREEKYERLVGKKRPTGKKPTS